MDKFRELRRSKNIGQVELAKQVGVSQAMISGIENGTRHPGPDTVEMIAQILGCSIEDLTGQPSFYIQFMRNCKKLTQAQIVALNEVVLQFIKD